MTVTAPPLRPGDCLLYGPKGFFGWIIRVKTWHPIAHVEVYVGAGQAAASRDGVGVGRYPVRLDELHYVLRPRVLFDRAAADAWYWREAHGQAYDWWGLLVFAAAVDAGHNGKMFCSEFATRFYRAGGLEPFHREEDADRIAPFQFLLSPVFSREWTDVDVDQERRHLAAAASGSRRADRRGRGEGDDQADAPAD